MGKKDTSTVSVPIVVGKKALDEAYEIIKNEDIRQKVKFTELETFPQGLMKHSRWVIAKNKKIRVVKYKNNGSATILQIHNAEGEITKRFAVAAAGEDENGDVETPESALKEMSDPYDINTRDGFTDCAYTDPIVAPGLTQRNNAFFENGYTLVMSLKSTINPITGADMNEQEIEVAMMQWRMQFGPAFAAIRQWAQLQEIDVIGKMKASHISTVIQGKHLTLITPPISVLPAGILPQSLTTLSTEETGNPIIDTLRRKIVAIRIKGMGRRKLALKDEMIYVIRRAWNLRRDSIGFGASDLEPALQASRSYKRLINFDVGKAVVAGYLRKIILKITATGNPTSQKAQITDILNGLIDDGTDVIGSNADVEMTPIDVKIDSPVIKISKDILEEVLIAISGSTKSQLGRTENLNRDTATIMELTNIKYIRSPDEDLIGRAFENQLFNPLLAQLTGMHVGDLPIKLIIVRKEKPETSVKEETLADKLAQLDDMAIKQADDDTGLGTNSSSIGRKVNVENTASNRSPSSPPITA